MTKWVPIVWSFKAELWYLRNPIVHTMMDQLTDDVLEIMRQHRQLLAFAWGLHYYRRVGDGYEIDLADPLRPPTPRMTPLIVSHEALRLN